MKLVLGRVQRIIFASAALLCTAAICFPVKQTVIWKEAVEQLPSAFSAGCIGVTVDNVPSAKVSCWLPWNREAFYEDEAKAPRRFPLPSTESPGRGFILDEHQKTIIVAFAGKSQSFDFKEVPNIPRMTFDLALTVFTALCVLWVCRVGPSSS